MTVSYDPVYLQTPKLALVQFLQGIDAAGTYKTLYTGGANGSKLFSLRGVTNDSAAAHLVTLQLVRSAVLYGGFAVNIPLSSGYTAAALSVNILAQWPGLPLDADGNPFLFLQQNDL